MNIKKWFVGLLSFFGTTTLALAADSSVAVNADTAANESIGDVAQNVFGAEMNLHQMIQVLCITLGIVLILLSFYQFKKHRKNPVSVSISTVITTFCIGVIIIGLGFIPFQLS